MSIDTYPGGKTNLTADLTSTANINLSNTTSSSVGIIMKNGYRFIHDYGSITNMFLGINSGNYSMTGTNIICLGQNSMASNTTGSTCVSLGNLTLLNNTIGNNNVALGSEVLRSNIDADDNVGVGTYCLNKLNSGIGRNVGIGTNSLNKMTSGIENVAVGYYSLYNSLTTSTNTAIGSFAQTSNTGGDSNVSVGSRSLYLNLTGASNIAIGHNSGYNVILSNCIHIGNNGVSTDNSCIRIGTAQTTNFQAGIRGITTTNANAINVVIDSAGQLGTVSSLRRLKENIINIDPIANSNIVKQLIPRRFNFIGQSRQTYGMIVDEVINICPDIIAEDQNGEPETIMYQHLPLILWREVQRLQEILETVQTKLALIEQNQRF